MKGGRVAVVDTEAFEGARERGNVVGHVLPQPGIVRRSFAVPQLHAIAPDDHLTTKIRLGWRQREVLKRVGVPDPAVVRKGLRLGVFFGLALDAREVRLHKR